MPSHERPRGVRLRARMPVALGLTLGVVALVGGAAQTFAQNDRVPVTVEWRATQCGSSEEVTREVGRFLGGDAVGSRAVEARATATKRASAQGGWRVVVKTRIDGRDGERTLDVPSCGEAIQATALVVALAVDPVRVAARQAQLVADAAVVDASAPDAARSAPTTLAVDAASTAPFVTAPVRDLADASMDGATVVVTTFTDPLAHGDAGGPAPLTALPDAGAPAAKDAVEADASTPPPSVAPPASHDGFSVAAIGIGDLGLLPALSGGGALLVGGELAPLRFELGVHALFPRETTSGRIGRFGAIGGEARGCYVLRVGADVELGPCVVVMGDRISAVAPNVTTPLDTGAGLLSAGAGGYFYLPLFAPLGVRAGVEALFPFGRPSFVVDVGGASQTIHTVSPVFVRGSAGLELRF